MSVVVCLSGRGSNLRALMEKGVVPQAVISDNPEAPGLRFAAHAEVPIHILAAAKTRLDFSTSFLEMLDGLSPRLVVLAGFMRVLDKRVTHAYAGRIINIHPSLLPAFPGLDTHLRAIASGVRLHGATVHYVNHILDGGPIISQAAVPVFPEDSPDVLATRVLLQEHKLLPWTVQAILEERIWLEDERVRYDPALFAPEDEESLFSPAF